MAIVKDQVVSIFYELKDTSGDILDSNIGSTPLSFIMGRNQVILGLEREISSMKEGDISNVTIKAVDAYGEYDSNAIQVLPSEQFAGLQLKNGMTLYGQEEDGRTVQVVVKEFNDESVTIDFNHPLAGKDLNFKVEIAEVRDATNEELENGYVAGSHSCSCGHDKHHDHGDDGCCGGHSHDNECCGRH